jgi:hypothetical protein
VREDRKAPPAATRILPAGEELIGFASYGPTEQGDTFKLHKLYYVMAKEC